MDREDRATRALRKNVTTACEACRESKIRCDGAAPTCSNCVKKSRECIYHGNNDKRRVSFRPALAILRHRIETLDNALLTAGIPLPPIDGDEHSIVNSTLESLGLAKLVTSISNSAELTQAANASGCASTGQNVGIGDEQALQHIQPQTAASDTVNVSPLDSMVPVSAFEFDDTVPFTDWSYASWEDAISPDWPWTGILPAEAAFSHGLGTIIPASQDPLTANGQYDNPAALEDDNRREDDFELDIVTQVAARFGSLRVAADGKLRYFGTPANANLLGTSNLPQAHIAQTLPAYRDSAKLLRDAGVCQHVPSAFEEHLLQIFFAWHNSCHPVMEESTFWKLHRQYASDQEGSAHYTSVLVNAMCAIGASYESKYHPDLVTFPRTLSEFFADRAKCLLEAELDSPCVATVQALLLLSSHELGAERIARSWLYSGMAMRLCFDLGLHLDATPYVEHGVLSATEAGSRKITFWSSYVFNYRSSFSLGRPFTLDKSEITVRKPESVLDERQDTWQPYPSTQKSSRPGELCSREALPALIAVILTKRIELSDVVEPVARALYGNVHMPILSLQEMSESATTAMLEWKRQLGAALKQPTELSEGTMPQLLVLHLEYHYLQILVHRPWTSRRFQPRPSRGRGYSHARKICIDSASEMAQLLELFERHFGYGRLDVETLQVLPSAALILIFAAIAPQEHVADNENSIVARLNTVLRALDEIGRFHACAREHLQSLLLIQRQWRTVYDERKRKIGLHYEGHESAESARARKKRQP